MDCLSPIVFFCVFNQSCGHWLFSDALHFVISLSLKLKEENQVVLSFESLMEEDLVTSDELEGWSCWSMKMEQKKCWLCFR